jgi:hypothetical protein
MKTLILTLLWLLFLSFTSVMAQQNAMHAKIEKSLLNAGAYNGFIELSPEYFQKGFVFGLAVSVNAQGRVDSVLFTNRTKILDSLVLFKRAGENFKKDKKSFLGHKNTVFVTLVLVRRGYDAAISNFPDAFQKKRYTELINFDDYFINAMPDVSGLSIKKRIVVIPTIGLIYGKAQP